MSAKNLFLSVAGAVAAATLHGLAANGWCSTMLCVNDAMNNCYCRVLLLQLLLYFGSSITDRRTSYGRFVCLHRQQLLVASWRRDWYNMLFMVLRRHTLYTCKSSQENWRQSPVLFLPERDYVTFGYLLPQIRLSSVCLSSVMFVHPTQPVKIFGNVSMPFCTLAIRRPPFTEIIPGNPSIGG